MQCSSISVCNLYWPLELAKAELQRFLMGQRYRSVIEYRTVPYRPSSRHSSAIYSLRGRKASWLSVWQQLLHSAISMEWWRQFERGWQGICTISYSSEYYLDGEQFSMSQRRR
mmetsp:Transcript_45008/g.108847  ORF Transcript_45008/g.108847 Transcript_45008/m.108847 type:complete len:113 (-) Transcript_45008:270-608(-)